MPRPQPSVHPPVIGLCLIIYFDLLKWLGRYRAGAIGFGVGTIVGLTCYRPVSTKKKLPQEEDPRENNTKQTGVLEGISGKGTA